MKEPQKENLFARLRNGLEESVAYSKGQLTLATTQLPAPPPRPKPQEIVSLRKHYHMSQAFFASVVNVSVKTVQSWEQGLRQPGDAALRMLQIIQWDPRIVKMIILSGGNFKSGKTISRQKAG